MIFHYFPPFWFPMINSMVPFVYDRFFRNYNFFYKGAKKVNFTKIITAVIRRSADPNNR